MSLRRELLEVAADSGTWNKTWKCCLLGKLDRTNLIYRLVLDFWKHSSSLRPRVPLTWKSIRCFWACSHFVPCKFSCSSWLPSASPILTLSWIPWHRTCLRQGQGHQGKVCSCRVKTWKGNIQSTKLSARAWGFGGESTLVIYRMELCCCLAFGYFCSQRHKIPTELLRSCNEFCCCCFFCEGSFCLSLGSQFGYFQQDSHIFKEEGGEILQGVNPPLDSQYKKHSNNNRLTGHLLVLKLQFLGFLISRDLESALTKAYSWVTRVLEGKPPFESLAADTRFIITGCWCSLYSF